MVTYLHRFLISINPRRSFRSRLGLAVGTVALALSLLLSSLVGYTASKQLEANTGKFLSELAYQMADKLDRGMFERYRDIQIAASLEKFYDPNANIDDKRILIEKLQSTYTDYAWIGLASPEGRVIISTGKILEGKNVSTRPWFINGQQQTGYVGDVHDALLLARILPNPTREPLRFVDVTAQVKDSFGNQVGILGAHLSWEWAKKVQESVLRSLARRENVEMLVLRQNGDVLLAPSQLNKFSGKNLGSFQAASNGKNNYLVETWQDGQKYLTGFAPSVGYLNYPGLNWIILVRQKTSTAFAGAQSLQRQVTIWGIALGLISATLSWLIANRIIQPILTISAAAERIRFGSNTNIPLVRGRDEIAILSASLSNLIVTLELQQSKLRILNDELQLDIVARQKAEGEAYRLNQELEMRVQQRTKQLEVANKELEAFSYSVSHDLSAPLRRIGSFSKMLMKSSANQLDTKGNHYLTRIYESIEQMQQLIEDMLLLAQVSKGEINNQKIDLSEMVRSISQDLATAEQKRQVEFCIAEGVTACADARLMRCVLENLIGNAWKYTRKCDYARIEFGIVDYECGESLARSQVYFIRDNGAGFDMKYSKNLFRPFQRLHSEAEFEGTGIGLATVQRIIHRHEGEIWAEAEVEKGTTIYFTVAG